MHAALMIFVFIIPAFAGLANFAVPLMLGAPDMAFPRLNALSFWFLPIAGTMFLCSFLAPGGAFATGWTSYAPLASEQPFGQVFFNMGVQWAGASSILTALNFLVTIITMRAPGMTFWRMPLLVWANFTTSLLVVIATPFIAGSQFFVMFDRVLHTDFFIPEGGGYVLGYQHIFWFYSHPAVYIMILPGFGIISEIISVMSRKPIFGYRLMAISLLGILVLGFSVWAHHMFVAGMADWLRVPMMISTLLIAVPTGVKVFSWLATLWEGRIRLNTPMLFALGFISMFVIGGLSGIYLASVPITIHASDTYFIVAHIHYVLFGGSVLTIFAGIYYWFPKMTGRMYNERLGKLHFWLTFVSFNLTFFPMHWVGSRRDAAARRRLLGPVRRPEPVRHDLVVCARRVGHRLLLQRHRQLGPRPDRRVEPVACDDARMAGRPRRRRSSTSTRSRRSSAARTSTAFPAPAMRSSPAAPCRRRPRMSGRHRSGCDDGPRRSRAHGHDHHGPPIANRSSRIESTDPRHVPLHRLRGDAVRLVLRRVLLRSRRQPDASAIWPPPPYEFPKFVAGINTAILVTSSFTMHWALQSIKRNNRRGLQAGLVLTILMGTAFLLTQFIEYAHVGFNTSDGAFASVFFGLTGLHGAHVFVGLTLLTIAAVRAFRGHYSPEHHHGVELPGIYWHFVDVMWIVVYATVYLL